MRGVRGVRALRWLGESGTAVGRERAIADGSGAPNSLLAKASVGTVREKTLMSLNLQNKSEPDRTV